MADRVCPKCSKQNDGEAKFCSNCGAKIPRLENMTQDMAEKMSEFGQKYQTMMEEWLEPRFKGLFFAPRLLSPPNFMEAVKFWGMFAPVYKDRLFAMNQMQNEDTPREMRQLYNDMVKSLFTDTLKGAQADLMNKYQMSQEEFEKFMAEVKAVSDETKAILEEMLDIEKEIQETMYKMPKDFVQKAFSGFRDVTEKIFQAPVLSGAEIGTGWLAYQEQFKELVVNFTALWQKYLELRMQSGTRLFDLHKHLLHDMFTNKFMALIEHVKSQNTKLLDDASMDHMMDNFQSKISKWQKEMTKTCNFFF